jgi:hypothetical protein
MERNRKVFGRIEGIANLASIEPYKTEAMSEEEQK